MSEYIEPKKYPELFKFARTFGNLGTRFVFFSFVSWILLSAGFFSGFEDSETSGIKNTPLLFFVLGISLVFFSVTLKNVAHDPYRYFSKAPILSMGDKRFSVVTELSLALGVFYSSYLLISSYEENLNLFFTLFFLVFDFFLVYLYFLIIFFKKKIELFLRQIEKG